MKKNYYIGFWFVVILNILDVLTTWFAISNGAQELNVIADFMMHHGWLVPFEYLGALIPTKVMVLTVIFFASKHKGVVDVPQVAAIWWIAGVYSLTVVLNLIHILLL